ncbi:MAG: hypothetical protein ABSH33_09920 [Steroidobacteraceae bacterium]|jgi:hypothetical protein
MKIGNLVFGILALGLCSASLAQSPFDGSWALNTAKSNLAGETMMFEDAGGGAIKFTDSVQTYTFKPDGSSFTTPMGADRTFLKNADGSYTSTVTMKGLLVRTSTWKASSNGKKLMVESKGTKPNGDSFDDWTTYVRTNEGTGLIGAWKATKVKLSTPNSLTIQSDGANGVTLTISAIKATCQGKWDGHDYPATGPTVSDGITLALRKSGTHGFVLVEKAKGKTIEIAHYHLAADGKSLTVKGTNGAGKEPFSEVWDKQG